jgi:peptidoglycan hydrolase-like protein with peptidoglycan-binding domain
MSSARSTTHPPRHDAGGAKVRRTRRGLSAVRDWNSTIKRFQDQIHARGIFPVGTRQYGPNTLAMVKGLQNQNRLVPNGEIGPNTWRLAWTGTDQVS